MIKILDKTGSLLKEINAETLSEANLRGADLRGADLRDADLIIITLGCWMVYITKGHIRIGCQSHSIDEWESFSDDEINDMADGALELWKENNELIIGLCKRFDKKESKND